VNSANYSNQLAIPVGQHDHIQGAETAAITLVEYGSYTCPNCAMARTLIQLLQQQLGEQLRIVFRHFPQVNLYPEAQHASEAAEAAAAQGKFWQMHDHLFTHQHALDDGSLVEYALAIGLDVNHFLYQMRRDVHLKRVCEDITSGVQSGVTHTPTFFINGVRLDSEWNAEALRAEISKVFLQK
jgi:protein-disulfide isomerase